MLVYLDLNCFNRPFDDQSQARIAQETQAVFAVLQRVEDGEDELIWSAVLTFENSQHPLQDRREEIARWGQSAVARVGISRSVSQRAQELVEAGVRALDAAHLAAAEASGCARFLTCDDRLLRTARRLQLLVVVENPVDYVEDVGDV